MAVPVSDTSKQVSLVEVQNLWAEKMSDPGNVRTCEDICIGRTEFQLDIVIFARCNSV